MILCVLIVMTYKLPKIITICSLYNAEKCNIMTVFYSGMYLNKIMQYSIIYFSLISPWNGISFIISFRLFAFIDPILVHDLWVWNLSIDYINILHGIYLNRN